MFLLSSTPYQRGYSLKEKNMPQLKDAPVLVIGQVIDTTVTTERGTGVVTGRKVTVMVAGDGDPGFAVVKLSVEDSQVYNPAHFETVTWWVRSAPYDIKDGPSGMSTRFLRECNGSDLDRLASNLKAAAGK